MSSGSRSPLKLIYAADDELDDETDKLLGNDSDHTLAPSASTVLRDVQHIAKMMPGAGLLHSSAVDPHESAAQHEHSVAEADLLQRGATRGKRRWVGVILIILLNLVSSFGTIAFAPMASIARDHFGFSTLTAINWLTLSSGFMYFLASPVSILVTRFGAKQALLAGSALLIIGSWLRFVGVHRQSYPMVLAGSLLVSASQPFALNLPVYYSDLWFDAEERVATTGLMTLASPLGQAVASLVIPLAVEKPSDMPLTMLVISIVTTVLCSFSILMPFRKKVHVISDLSEAHVNAKQSVYQGCVQLLSTKAFLYILVQFSILVAAFNAVATLSEQMTNPLGYTAVQAGMLTAAMVILGLIASAIGSPILDKSRAWKLPTLMCVSTATVSYFLLAGLLTSSFSSLRYSVAIALYALIGASSLIILPLALELAADVSYPVDTELPATIMWMLGQLLGACFILSMDKLKNISSDGTYGGALLFLVVVLCLPLPMAVLLARSGQVEKGRALRNGEDG
ncbi:major facilitator superfamily domain-containing protein [Protomyces lactucae-debilis]|uniref:Major facilitator superfamily domain-containing protein n=1 Tax=Protomyces lactucae-debilis TaxID=2754530 RepID=A0A1Y2F0I9_PROLT|nr:major facilitator superfamily domain-containing protein [Protomyces lactucae-debilis]ORY77353.1 major facilitator superfamily domain-containing protein [Protomyces lactucae-debilis]